MTEGNVATSLDGAVPYDMAMLARMAVYAAMEDHKDLWSLPPGEERRKAAAKELWREELNEEERHREVLAAIGVPGELKPGTGFFEKALQLHAEDFWAAVDCRWRDHMSLLRNAAAITVL
ncbi:hypothetical protein [Devosia sp.]|uniref:hypothetical protein n=1 Tax=Devosia sp. TaxID=1871048 RepID=UPI002FCC709E